MVPISRDPPEGGTQLPEPVVAALRSSFQFLGIPPKGELKNPFRVVACHPHRFQFLGIPPKGELAGTNGQYIIAIPVSNF